MHKLTKSQITVAIFGFQLSAQHTTCIAYLGNNPHSCADWSHLRNGMSWEEQKRSQKEKHTKKTKTIVKLFWCSNFVLGTYKKIAKILRTWKLSHRSKMMIIKLMKTVLVLVAAAVAVMAMAMLMMMTLAFGKDFVSKNFSNNVDLMGRTTM